MLFVECPRLWRERERAECRFRSAKSYSTKTTPTLRSGAIGVNRIQSVLRRFHTAITNEAWSEDERGEGRARARSQIRRRTRTRAVRDGAARYGYAPSSATAMTLRRIVARWREQLAPQRSFVDLGWDRPGDANHRRPRGVHPGCLAGNPERLRNYALRRPPGALQMWKVAIVAHRKSAGRH
jgi:hypothetical protein